MSNAKSIIRILLLVACIVLVIYGRITVGYQYLLLQLIGLIGVLVIFWDWNRQFK